MAKISKEMMQQMVSKLGGSSNIVKFGNCMTRLRITIKKSVDIEEIKAIDGVLGVVLSGNEVQIVLGPGKATLAAELMSEILGRDSDFQLETAEDAINDLSAKKEDLETAASAVKSEIKAKQVHPIQKFLSKFATIFTPLIPGFIAAGLMLGIATLLEQNLVVGKENVPSLLLQSIGYLKLFSKGMFSFMSILIGYNASVAFGGSGIIGGILASFFILGYNPDATSGIYSGIKDFFGIKIDPRGNIIGVLISSISASYLERKIRRIVPSNLDMLLTTSIVLLIMGCATFLIVMPAGFFLFKGMSFLFANLSGNPIGAAVLSGLFLIAVLFGIHQGFVPVYFGLMEKQGFNSLFPILAMAGAGQVGAALALYVRAKSHSNIRRQIAGAIIPGFLGIGEPLIYGITLPRIKPFVTACLGGAAGGFFIGMIAFLGFPMGLNSAFGPSGLVALPLMTSGGGALQAMTIYFLGLVVSYIAGFLITFFFGTKNVDLS